LPARPSAAGADGGAIPLPPLSLATRRTLTLAALSGDPARLVIAKGRVGVLAEDALIVRATPQFEQIARIPMAGPRGIAVLAEGSIFAVGAAKSVRLVPRETKARVARTLLLLPTTTLLGDRIDANRVWAFSRAGSTLFGYDVNNFGALAADQWIDLTRFDHRDVASLRDGAFLYTTADGLRRFYGANPSRPIAGGAEVRRLVAASRPDTVWLVKEAGADLCRVAEDEVVRLTTVKFGAVPMAVRADGEYLAALELRQPPDAPWAFVVEVFDVRGKPRFTDTLPATESTKGSWVAELFRDRSLAVSADPPLVIVGGDGSVRAWDARTGTPVFAGN
jgi:hypothetical protein